MRSASFRNGSLIDSWARYPSGKGEVCKTFMRRFESGPRLYRPGRTAQVPSDFLTKESATAVPDPWLRRMRVMKGRQSSWARAIQNSAILNSKSAILLARYRARLRRARVVRERSAKPLCAGTPASGGFNPARASKPNQKSPPEADQPLAEKSKSGFVEDPFFSPASHTRDSHRPGAPKD